MKIPTETLAVLDQSITTGNVLELPGQLERKTYLAVAKIIEAAGGKWARKAGAHVFPGDASEALEQILLTGECTPIAGKSYQQQTQQFFTPPELAARVVAAAGVKAGDNVLEPSAGGGALALAAEVAGASVFCIEKDPKFYTVLSNFARLSADFLNVEPWILGPFGNFDAVVMNPPFANQADMRHVMHAEKFLRPGGRLAAIMSPSFTFRANGIAVDFRAFLHRMGAKVEHLPEGSFKASGTAVNTVLVSFTIPG